MPSKNAGTCGFNLESRFGHCKKRRGWSGGLGLERSEGIRIELERREESLRLNISFCFRFCGEEVGVGFRGFGLWCSFWCW